MIKKELKLPEEFYKEEVRNDYKISSEMKKIWSIELDLFNQLDRICKKHNITYYADSGTLLGAIRHHGFIPWDDDMDFVMCRSDFEKLCNIAHEFKKPYFFQTEETDQGSLRCHAQLRNSNTTGILKSEKNKNYSFNQGIFIDIFPLDNVPDDITDREKFSKELKQLKGRARSYFDYNHGKDMNITVTGVRSFIKRILHKGYHKVLYTKYGENNPFYAKYKNKVTKYDHEKTKFVMDIAISDKFLYKEDLSDPVYVPFEMLQMPVPKNYNRILSIYYGNWKQPAKAPNVHGGCIFDPDKPYTEYIK